MACYALRHPLDFCSSFGPTLNELSFGLLGSSFDPRRDIGDLSGKVVFITGGKDSLPLLCVYCAAICLRR